MKESTPTTVGFGETMIRLSPGNYEKFGQANRLDLGIGGTESNFVITFGKLGGRAGWISRITDNFLGRYLVSEIRKQGIDVSDVIWTDEDRVGVYFIEIGREPRASKVVYDREDSAISNLDPEEVDWEVLERYDLLFTTGITAALSKSCEEAVKIALEKADNYDTEIFFDVNYRSKLWTPEEAFEVLDPILKEVDIISVTKEDAEKVLQVEGEYEEMIRELAETYDPEVTVLTLGSDGGMALKDGTVYESEPYEIESVDRIGAGDAQDAGFAYQYMRTDDVQKSLDWGIALAAYAHTLPGDVMYFENEEIEKLVDRKTSGMDVSR